MINPSHYFLKVGIRVKRVQENEHSIKYCFVVPLKYCKNVMVHANAFHTVACIGVGGGGATVPPLLDMLARLIYIYETTVKQTSRTCANCTTVPPL